MEKTIKYLENGEYHYATVRDVGDLAKLKTDSKDDLVTAINELYVTGGEAPKKPDGYDELVDNVADAIQKQQQMTDTITNMQQSAQLSDAEMEHMKQVQEELHQEYLKAIKELNEAVDKAKADAADLDKKTSDLQDKLDETFASVDKEVSDVHKQLDSESAGLRKDLDDTKTSLESTRKDLLNNTQEFGVVNSEVKELKDKMDRRIWSTDLDPVREQVSKNSTEVQQAKDELKRKADQSNLDLVTNSVEDLSAQVKQNASGLEVAVKRDELGGDVSRLLSDKTNLLLGTRNFGGANWSNKVHWREESGYWNGLKVYSSDALWFGLQQAYQVIAGNTYTFSFYAKQDKENRSAHIVLTEGNLGDTGVVTPYQTNTIVSTDWKRYSLVFRALSDGIIFPRVEQSVEDNRIYVAGYKLELGKNATPWEPNEADVAENIEKNESRFNVFSDQITGLVKKQEKMGDTERQLDTRITETAEGLKQTSKNLEDANGKITEFKGQLESTARGLKTEYEKYTNDAIGQISDSSLNLIHNSAFQNKDDNFAQWQNISAKANIREDGNGLRWVEITQSGMTTSNPQGITSNYFGVKQGKVTVAVDIKNGDKAELDNDSVMFLELYNNEKKRVDFHWVTLSDLGLSKSLLNDHQVHRGLYRLAIDRTDAKYMTVKAHIIRNGDLWFTNFSARLSSIDDGGYTPNPDDLNQQILKMNTKIEEDAEHIALKANSVDVTRDIKSAVDGIQVGGRNLVAGTNQEYIMGFGIPDTTWKDGFAYATLPTAGNGVEILPQDPHAFWYALTPGREYTQTIWFQTDATVKDLKAASITWFTNDGHDQQPATIQRIGLNSYKIFSSYKWPGKQHNNVRLFDISELRQAFDLKTGTYLKFGKLKLEEGNKSTSWAPAPEDISTEIKSAKDAAIQVASDQINIHVNELSTSFDDKLNKRVNEVKTASEKFTSDGIEQTVRKITNVKNDVDRLDQRVATNNGGGINLLRGTGSEWKTLTGSVWFCQTTGAGAVELGSFTTGDTVTYSITVRNNSQYAVRPEIVGFSDDNGTRSFNISGTESVQPGETKTVSVSATVAENTVKIIGWLISSGAEPTFSVDAKNEKLERGSVATPWSPNPQDAKTYTDSQIVNTNKKIDTQTLDSANIDQMKTQGHYFVHNLTGNPIGGWVYVDVIGNNNDRVRQDVYADQNNQHKYRSWNGLRWSDWEQGAYLSDVKTEVTASVKNLGDRVTTEVNSITSRVDNLKAGSQNLVADGDASAYGATPWENTTGRTHPYYYNSTKLMFVIDTSAKTELTAGCPNWFPVKAGHQYTLYFNGFMSTNVSSYDVWLLGKKADAQGGWTDSYQIITGERLSPSNNCIITRTFTVPSSWNNYVAYVRFDNNGSTDGHSAVFFFNEVSLKEGNINTGYSPAPENTVNEIKELNTKWDVANGQIQGKVTATDVNNILNGKGYVTQSWAESNFRMKSDSIDLEVRKITDPISNKINNLQVGGRNLLANSSNDISVTSHTTDGYPEWAYIDTGFSFEHGKTYTFSAEAKNSTDKIAEASIRAFEGSTNTQVGIYAFPADGERHSVTFTIPNDSHDYHLLLFAGHAGIVPGVNVTTTFHHPKLELGNVATDWSPAPEDIDKKIDTQTLDSANIDQMKTQGHYFVKNLTGNPIGGWVYVDVNCADQWRIRQDVYQDIGGSHVYRRLNGSSWTEWTTDVNNKNIISQINITPDQIKIASNKIVLDGDTEIKGTAFIPSAAIKDITADKITTGTLSGITIRAGDEDGFFQTSEDNIYWITNSGGSAVIGKGKYVQYPGLNVFDNNAVYLGSWAGAELNKDGTINDYGGAIGNPKLAIETGGMRRRFNVDSWGGEFEDKPLDNSRIISWVGNKEFLSVERENGTHIELNPDINGSQFTIQKDDKFGAYFGQGRDGNEINFTPIGGMTINGNFRVTGAKNAIVKTSQGTVAINAYETAGYFFGDIGSAKTSDNKVAMIDIESLFKETVNTDVEYQVFLTSYGPGDIWVSERQRDYFVVESELPNMEFGWEIKAKRKGYENTRLAKVDVSNVPTV